MPVKGRNLSNGFPVTMDITAVEVSEALRESVESIVDTVKSTLEMTPPELLSDIVQRGIVLTGGGALLQGMDEVLYRQTGLPTIIADHPLECVALGVGRMLDNIDVLRRTPRYRSANTY